MVRRRRLVPGVGVMVNTVVPVAMVSQEGDYAEAITIHKSVRKTLLSPRTVCATHARRFSIKRTLYAHYAHNTRTTHASHTYVMRRTCAERYYTTHNL